MFKKKTYPIQGQLDSSIADELYKLHITLPTNRENVLKYMLDADESSSEANIIILGIVDISDSDTIEKDIQSLFKKISIPIIIILK